MQLIIKPSGDAHCVYSEAWDLRQLGELSIRRGSHVEPDSHGQWWADLAPVQGPRLGPFQSRSQALIAERDWLHRHWLMKTDPAS